MTHRARWLSIPALAGACLGILRGQQILASLSLAVLMMLAILWLLFLIRVRSMRTGLRLTRSVNGRTGGTGWLWAGRTAHVTITIEAPGAGIPTVLQIRDIVPEIVGVEAEQNAFTVITTAPSLTYAYHAVVRGAGNAFFPGFRITLRDDFGFFRVDHFLRCPQHFRILPAYADVGDAQPQIKRMNSLPQHGIHRLQRSGMGSELLELRDYVIGDPPRSIAWKVSARRDRLMTRQYESEVPVRVQLIMEGTTSCRAGGFGSRLIDQMSWVAASIARASISVGDPVGAVLIDDRGRRRVTPGTGDRGFHRLAEAISDFCVSPPPPPLPLTASMETAAMTVLSERFPELLQPRVLQLPLTLFPILPWKSRRFHQRKILAVVMAEIYDLSASEQVRLLLDDRSLAVHLQHFLSQSGASWMPPVLEDESIDPATGKPIVSDGLARMALLSEAIRTAVTHARDNEVFVILADLTDCAQRITHLLPAVRMARARHHRVAFVIPSPTFRRPTRAATEFTAEDLESMLAAAAQVQTRMKAQQLQRTLNRLGAAVSWSGEANAVRLVLSEIELARTGRTRMSGAHR